MSFRFFIATMCVCLYCGLTGNAQGSLVPGMPMPDLQLDVQYVQPGRMSIADFKGKPLLLLFFGKGCEYSFRSLPRISDLYQQYKGEFNLVMIGIDRKGNGIRTGYERYRDHYNLKLPVAYDSINKVKLSIRNVPTVFWIDSFGIIKAITSSLDSEALAAFVTGKDFPPGFNIAEATSAARAIRPTFDQQVPYASGTNAGKCDEYLQRSLFAAWRPGMPHVTLSLHGGGRDLLPLEKQPYLQVLGADVKELYRIAYFGRQFPWDPVDTAMNARVKYSLRFEVSDTSNITGDFLSGKNLYCYSQVLPAQQRTVQNKMETMQHDLKSFFGYDASVEIRMEPCLKLVASPGVAERLKTKGKVKHYADAIEGGTFRNLSITSFCSLISMANRLVRDDRPIINATGIKTNIDIDFWAVMIDLNDVRRELRRHGFDLVETTAPMKVLVLRDPLKSELPKP